MIGNFNLGIISLFCGIMDPHVGNLLKLSSCLVYIPCMYFYYENESIWVMLKEYLKCILLLLPLFLCYSFNQLYIILQLLSLAISPIVYAKGLSYCWNWCKEVLIASDYSKTILSMISTISIQLSSLEFQIMYQKTFQSTCDAGIINRRSYLENKRKSLYAHLQQLSLFKENTLFVFSFIVICSTCIYSIVIRITSLYLFPYPSLLLLFRLIDVVYKVLGCSSLLKDYLHIEPLFYLKSRKRLRKKNKIPRILIKDEYYLFNTSLIVLSSLELELNSFYFNCYQIYYLWLFVACLVYFK